MSISEHFYKEHLSEQQLRPLDGLMHVVGAGGQEVPFLGYVKLDIGFPCVEAGTDKVFSTLVLVVLANSYNQHVHLILGTNLTKKCRDDCQQKGGWGFLWERNVSGTWKRAVVPWSLTHACPGEGIKVIVEPTEAQPYWSAATVTPSLVCLPSSGSSNGIPVEITNSLQSITLPPKAVLASLQVASEV